MALITNCVILGLDDNLFISGTDSGYGGRYGMPGWYVIFSLHKDCTILSHKDRFTSQDKLIAASKDLELWRILNAIRGFAGCFNWILCSLCIDKTRTWSIVDSKNNQPRFMSKDQLAIV